MFQFAANESDGVGGDPRVERLRAIEAGYEVAEEVFDGGEEFVGGGSVLHAPIIKSVDRLGTLRGWRAFC